MVNPRGRPKIANSRFPDGKSNEGDRKALFSVPKTEPYVGSHIKSDLAGKKVSNKSYEKYYKDLI